LNKSAYLAAPNSLDSCDAKIESSVDWIFAADVAGSKIMTLGPKSGLVPGDCAATRAAVAVARRRR